MNTSQQFDEATQPQVNAADPRASSWVSAHAGSGKTKVLTDRVARLLLAGTPPQRILCLTFTVAAASNMHNRLIGRLGDWAMMPDAELRQRLLSLGAEDQSLSPERLRSARTLFARALETPGGLKIQTIHSFGNALLRKFPLEAGVSPQFRQIDDLTAKQLMEQVLDSLAASRSREFDDVAVHLSGTDIHELVGEIASKREHFSKKFDPNQIRKLFELEDCTEESEIDSAAFQPDHLRLLDDLMSALEKSKSKTDRDALQQLREIGEPWARLRNLKILEKFLLFGASAANPFGPKTRKFPTKTTQRALGEQTLLLLDHYMELVSRLRLARIKNRAANKTLALHRYARLFLCEYELLKRKHAFLDYHDLIFKSLQLLSNPDTAQWVLYRLDGGIDHILVDEAQDVSPGQWEIVTKLTEEFTSGQGMRGDLDRTVFTVGDEKQSIYGFQGARPERFAEMRDYYEAGCKDAGKPFRVEQLRFSFRSSYAILNLVDNLFTQDAVFTGDKVLSIDGSEYLPASGNDISTICRMKRMGEPHVAIDMPHRAFKSEMPGRVDLWPFIHKKETQEQIPWWTPEHRAKATPPHTLLAQSIATFISTILKNGELRPDGSSAKPISPGDIMILVQRRGTVFRDIIRELKVAGLPVAGTDRLRVRENLAVKDLIGLLSFLAVPADDLSLAAVLKSPLFGLSEQELYSLAVNRDESSLFDVLKSREADHPDAVRILNDLRSCVDHLKPYDLLERILTVHQGRKKLLSRLGKDVAEAIDALLLRVLNHEEQETSSLTGFLEWTSADDLEVKRQLDQAGNEIRIMTVHAAKGLEAPVVILPDTEKRTVSFMDEILMSEGGIPLWKTKQNESVPVVECAMERYRYREREERLRLLYVALTRAENWLIVCGAGGTKHKPDEIDSCWYSMIEANGMRGVAIESLDFSVEAGPNLGHSTGWRKSYGKWPERGVDLEDRPESPVALPGWSRRPAPVRKQLESTLAPSTLGGEKSILSGKEDGDRETAMRTGTALHLMLEHLPKYKEQDRQAAIRNILKSSDCELEEGLFLEIFEKCSHFLVKPELKEVFAPGSLPEVRITARLDGLDGRPIYGSIDRLTIGENRILAVDFKSNRIVPDDEAGIPEAILRQMGAYQEALESIYDGKPVQTAILWSRTGELMEVSRERCLAALARSSPE